MKTFIFFLVLILLGVGVWYYIKVYEPSLHTTETTTVTDTLVVVKDSIINATVFDTIPSGLYQGMMPCKNCEGLQRTIAFSGDDHFKMEEWKLGTRIPAKITEGNWEKVKNRFVLYVNDKPISTYKLVRDSLINTENNGSRISDSLSKQYVLFKKNTAPENPVWKRKKSEGIDIIGNGSEPFWNIEIDKEKMILFKLASVEKPVIIPIEKPSITKDSTVYTVATESGTVLKVSISSKFCHDGMSDHLYEYKMTIWYNGQIYKGCAVLLNKNEDDD